jgi:hypothetical protein
MTSRKHHSAAFWATVVVVAVLVGYPLSFGPACWLVDRQLLPSQPARSFYDPLLAVIARSPKPVKDVITRYCKLLPPPNRITGASGMWWILTDDWHRHEKR